MWGADYHVPQDEYGVHWNFFFTIAGVTCICQVLEPALAACAVKSIPSSFSEAARGIGRAVAVGSCATFICVLTQLWHVSIWMPVSLDRATSIGEKGMQVRQVWQWMLYGQRSDFISGNKEGIFSLPGYVALRLFGTACGSILEILVRARRPLLLLVILMLSSTVFLFFPGLFFYAPSRRLCNAAFVSVITGINLYLLAIFLAADVVAGCWRSTVGVFSYVLEGWQCAPLSLFLLANVLTGLVNLTLPTAPLFMPPLVGVFIVQWYSAILCAVSIACVVARRNPKGIWSFLCNCS